MARTKATRRKIHNEERLRRKAKQDQQPKDSREFYFFDQLPQDLKEEIFKYIPFYYWVTTLSNVCKEWGILLRKARCQKIMEVSKFYFNGYKSDFLINVARSFQITGLDVSGCSEDHKWEVSISEVVNSLLVASNELTWVNLIPFTKGDLWGLELQTLPASVKNLSIPALDMLQDKDLSNLEYLRIEEIFEELNELDEFHFPMLQELYIEDVELRDNIKQQLADLKKKVAPKLKRFCLGIKQCMESVSEEECIQLEDLAAGLGFQFCCRKLYLMIGNDFDLFVRSFVKQGLLYEYYSTSTQTLLSHASTKSDIQVVKFLLENQYTTMSYELDKNCIDTYYPTLLLPLKAWTKEGVAIIDYLLQHPEYHPGLYPGAALVVLSDIETDYIRQLFLNRKLDLKVNSGGLPVIHEVVSAGWMDVLQYQLDGLNHEQVLALISCKDDLGNTPLHHAFLSSNFLLAKYLKELGASFTELNNNGQSPPSSAPEPTLLLVEMAPEIPNDFVLRCLEVLDDEMLLAIVKRGVDLSSVWNGKPIIWQAKSIYEYSVSKLKCLRDYGFNFEVVDDRNYSLLFHDMAYPRECLTWLVAKIGLDVNHIANDGLSPLTSAFQFTDDIPKTLQHMDTLIQLGAKVPDNDHTRTWATMIDFIQSVINYQATDSVEEDMALLLRMIEAVLQSGIDLNERVEEEGKPTRLMQFCLLFDFEMSHGNELIGLLLKYEGDINASNLNGNTLTHLIQTWNFLEILLNHGLNPNTVNSFGETALFYSGEVKLQELHYQHSLDINHVSSYGSPLIHHLLTSEKNEETVLTLLTLNPDLSLLDGCGRSAAHLLNHTTKGVAKYLIASVKHHRTADQKSAIKAAFQHIDKFGHSALYYIVQLGFCRIVKQFVENFELEVNCPSEDQTPLHLSVSLPLKGGYKIAQFLLSCGANVNAQTLDGNTPLHMACNYKSKDYQKIKQLLLENGASVTIKNKYGVSPLDLDPTLKIAAN